MKSARVWSSSTTRMRMCASAAKQKELPPIVVSDSSPCRRSWKTALLGANREERGPAVARDRDHRGPVALLGERLAHLGRRAHRPAVDGPDDVAWREAGTGRRAARRDARDDDTCRVIVQFQTASQ